MTRDILHVDCNKFYASVECCLHPELRNKPVAVGGNEADRHGIVLTKNEIASRYGLTTGEPLWSARQKCPDLVVVPPHFDTNARFSSMVREILADYSPNVEPFGLDEARLDVTGCPGDAVDTAHAIRQRVKQELGITVSVGVSFNKCFAKLGSDYKKPDAVTVFTPDNFKQLVWPLPSDAMLYVGPATRDKLAWYGVHTIGDIANTDPTYLRRWLGKWGPALHAMANGRDNQPVKAAGDERAVQSVSNGVTTRRDLQNRRDVERVIYALSESVGRRLREQSLVGKTVELHLRDNRLQGQSYRITLPYYLHSTGDIAETALMLFDQKHRLLCPLRAVTVSVTSLEPDSIPCQLDMLTGQRRQRRETLDKTVDSLRRRFGDTCLRRAVLLEDPALTGSSVFDTHTVHPTGFSGKLEDIGGRDEL